MDFSEREEFFVLEMFMNGEQVNGSKVDEIFMAEEW